MGPVGRVHDSQSLVINNFRGRYSFLSNFFIEPDGTHVEAEYQSSKHEDPAKRAELRVLMYRMTPGQAKRHGGSRKLMPLREDWELVKRPTMKKLVLVKYLDWIDLADALLATDDAEIIESNTWGDTYWGICRGKGRNELGKIHMEIREQLR